MNPLKFLRPLVIALPIFTASVRAAEDDAPVNSTTAGLGATAVDATFNGSKAFPAGAILCSGA